MEILEARKSHKLATRRLRLKSLMVNHCNPSSSSLQVGQISHCNQPSIRSAEEKANQTETRRLISKQNLTSQRRRRRKQVVARVRDTNCDRNEMEKIQFTKPKMSTTTWLAYLILLIPALQVALSPLPAAEAWNFFEGTQANEAGKFSSYSNASSSSQQHHQQLQSIAADGLLNVAAAAQSLVTGSSDSNKQSEPSDSMRPSPLGKILGEQASNSPSSTTSGSGASDQPARSASGIAMQLLKPRKSSSSLAEGSSKQQAAALEQQIINQHSRAHHHLAGGGSHQRLLPTKHRDHKVVSSIMDHHQSSSSSSSGSSGSSDSRDSPLASILGGFKSSAITSRSSIVKAISDNKLARTLSTVSKTLGGNKYVAGAAAASALAALGLTVSKFLGPYFLAGGYNKLGAGDPMIGAGSYLSPSFAPAQNYFQTDRNYVYSSPSSGDSMLASGSSSPMLVRSQQQQQFSSSLNSYPYSGSNAEFSYDPATGSYEQLGSPSSSSSSSSAATANGLSGSSSEPIYLTYSPRPKSTSSSATGSGQEPSAKQSSADSTGGHYTSFYSQQQVDSAQPSYENQAQGGNYQQQQQQPQGYYTDQRYTSSSSSSGLPSASAYPSSSQQETGEATNSNLANFYSFNNNNNQPQQYEQLLPAASIESPSYTSKPINVIALQSAPKARRVGSVSLKMDDATRARLFQHLLKQQHQPMRISASPLAGTASGDNRLGQSEAVRPAGLFVPISSAAPSAEVYTSGSLQQPQQTKSGRMVPNGGNGGDSGLYIGYGGLSASLDNGQSQQQQQQQQPRQVQGQPQVGSGYMILRPNTDQQQQGSSSSSSWRSLAIPEATTSGSKSAWQQPVNKHQVSNPSDESSQQQQQPPQDDDQQASDSAPRSRLADPIGQPQVANGRLEEQQQQQQFPLSHRVSRTPNQSSVTELGEGEGATGASRRPVESLTNYAGSSGKGSSGGSMQGSTNLEPATDYSSHSHHHSNHQGFSSSSDAAAGGVKASEQKLLHHKQQVTGNNNQQQQQQHDSAAAQPPAPATGGDDSKLNLIQLNANNEEMDNNNKNNVIKLIDANTNGGSNGKLATNLESQYDAGLVIMSPPSQSQSQSQQQQRGSSNLDDTHSGDGVSNQQHRWSTLASASSTGKSASGSPETATGTLPRSSFGEFAAGD